MEKNWKVKLPKISKAIKTFRIFGIGYLVLDTLKIETSLNKKIRN